MSRRTSMTPNPTPSQPFSLTEETDWRIASIHNYVDVVSILPNMKVSREVVNPGISAWFRMIITLRPMWNKATRAYQATIVTNGDVYYIERDFLEPNNPGSYGPYALGPGDFKGKLAEVPHPGSHDHDLIKRSVARIVEQGNIHISGEKL